MNTVDLSKYSIGDYNPGNRLKRILWYLVNIIFYKTSISYPVKSKVTLLRAFGAKIGKNVVIKPSVNIKYPWFLEIGDNVWLGEEVWIDSLGYVRIGSNVCISQGAYIFTGNHDYKKATFDLVIKPVSIEDGVWIGAKAIVCLGITLRTHSVITAGSVVAKNTEPYTIYQGNPARSIRHRKIEA